jgi:hypothetical protein
MLPTPLKTVTTCFTEQQQSYHFEFARHGKSNFRFILSNENDSFTVDFDFKTPRSHFIILPKIQAGAKHEFSMMTQRQTGKLLDAVQSMISRFSISSGILSNHRGSWFPKTKTIPFHAHIYINVELYLQIFEKEQNILEISYEIPSNCCAAFCC